MPIPHVLYELEEEHLNWLSSRPEKIKEMFKKKPGNILYRLRSTGEYCILYSYNESGNVTVTVPSSLNENLMFEKQVFGVPLDDLEEVEMPDHYDPDREPRLKTVEEIEVFVELSGKIKVHRPN